MNGLWSSLIPLIVGSALVPIQIVITVLLLRSSAGRITAVAWVAGMTTVRLAQGVVFGLVLGSAIALANDGKNTSGIIRWSLVGGTFFGFGYGVYYVSTRPSARALIEVEEGKFRLGALSPTIAPGGVRVALVTARF